MAPATLKEPETPRAPGFKSGLADFFQPAAYPSERTTRSPIQEPIPLVSTASPPLVLRALSSREVYPGLTRTPPLYLPPSHQPSSGAWTPQDDQQLIAARAQGLNWSQIKDGYFPGKTANACRKRHERLAERGDAADSDARKFHRLAKEYMATRKQIWSRLAAHVGESWEVVEAKCMASGLGHMRSVARAAARHDRLSSETRINFDKNNIGSGVSTASSNFDVDSGIFSMTSGTSYRVGSSSTRWETPLLETPRSPWDDDDSCTSSEPDYCPSPWSSADVESNAEVLEAERTPSEPYDPSGQVAPTGSRSVTTRTAWEGTNYFQVEIGPHTVSRREDNDMINATKLFNVADVPRGRRDSILKSERIRQVVTEGPTHLKGVWIPYERALVFANTYQLTRVVHPLFAHNINAYLRKARVPVPTDSATQEAAPTELGALKLEHWRKVFSKPKFPPEPEKSGDSGYCEGPVQPDPPSSLKSLSGLTDQRSLPTEPPSPEEAQRAQIPEPETVDSKADMLSATSESGLSNSSSSEEEEPSTLSKDGQKRLLLNRLMKYFYEIFSSCPTHRGSMRTHTSGGRQGTSDSGSFRSGLSSSGASNQPPGGGRKRPADDELGEGDDQGGRAPKRPRGSDPLDESKEEPAKRLACPYFKMDPSRHHTARSCLGPGWATVHRIKEHLYRCHSRPISCPRCHETFENDRAKDEHMAAEVRCEIVTRDGARNEGFDSTQKELLRSRKKAHKQMTEIEKWYDVYMILFPGAHPTNLPSPYYEYVNADSTDGSSPTSELSRYEQFLRRELPTQVRQQLEIRIEEELEPVEEHLRAQLVEIVRDMQLQLFDLYKASRTDKPQADAQGPSEPQEQPEPEKPEPHEGDADPSSFHEGGVVEPAQQSFHAPALPPVPSWNPTIDEQLEAFRPEPPYTGDYFDDFNGLLFDFHPSLLTGSNSPGDSGYMSIPSFADYMQPKAQSHPQPGAGPDHPPFDGRRN